MKKISVILIVSILLASCANKKDEKIRLISKITKMEKDFTQSLNLKKIDPVLTRDLASEYSNFSNLFPDDTNSPGMIYKAGIINLKYINDQNKAIDLFIKLKEKYPKAKNIEPYTLSYIRKAWDAFALEINQESAKRLSKLN